MISELYVLWGTGTDPYHNLALEELLLDRICPGRCILYLWQNENTVVIGRNQNPWAEADIEYENTHGIRLARRFSGGGAVYQDTGNLNYSFILPEQEADIADRWLADAFHVMGIHPIPSGRNDWLIKERKFSGCARCEENGWILIHGTLMIHVDLEQLEKVLCPSPLKLRSRGIESVRSRVINLQEVIPALTVSDAANAFKAAVPADFWHLPGIWKVIHGYLQKARAGKQNMKLPDRRASTVSILLWKTGL